MNKKITIIGGGIAGLTTAISLQSKGFEPIIFEATPEIKSVGAGLVLAANAMKAYRQLGLLPEIEKEGNLIPSFVISDEKGNVITKTDGAKLSQLHSISSCAIHRADLHTILLSKIKPENLFLGKKTIDFSESGNMLTVKFEDGTTHQTEILIVAEGIHSVIRKKILPKSNIRYAGYTCWRAVIDSSDLEINAVSETWGSGRRFGIVPLSKNRIYWFACINGPQNCDKFKKFTVDDLKKEFVDFHKNVHQILNSTQNKDLHLADIIDLEPIHNFAFKNILLIGDAAHATTPNMGQGACQAIEDAIVISEELKKSSNVTTAFEAFEKRRIKRTHNIVSKSWQLGKIGQLENKLLINLRNFVFRRLPESLNENQLNAIYNVDFE